MSALLAQLDLILAPWDAADNASTAPHTQRSSHIVSSGQTSQFQAPPLVNSAIPVSFLHTVHLGDASGEDDRTPSATQATGHTTPSTHVTSSTNTATLLDVRQRNTKLELARAALAVFTSNAGEFRPTLQKTLTFLFQYMDFLLEERGRNVLELAAARHLTRQAQGSGSGMGASASGADDEEAGGAENDLVAAAHQRVRLVEAKMAALVEEASAQRDRYKAQIIAHEQQAARLESLLVHQMELTEMLLHDKSATEGHAAANHSGGSNAGGVATAPTVGSTGGRPGQARTAGALMASAHDRAHATTSLWSDETWAQRDRTYVQQLIARAEREQLVADLETQVSDLKAERGRVQGRVQDLLGLNARYARQAVELAARMSVIHDQNIALATDVQLFQRDTAREQQRADKLLRDLGVSRQMLLTLLEVRAQELQSSMMMTAAARHAWGFSQSTQASSSTSAAAGAATALPSSEAPLTLQANTALLLHAAAAPAALTAAEELALTRFSGGPTGALPAKPFGFPAAAAAKPLSLEDDDLRAQLEDLLLATSALTLEGTDVAASTRSVADHQHMQRALERMLLLRQETRHSERRQDDAAPTPAPTTTTTSGQATSAAATSSTPAPASLLRLPPHLWAAPYGRHRHVPLHLRTTRCTRLLPLHPLVAENYVQELLSQRMDLRLGLRRRQLRDAEERAAAIAAGVLRGGGGGGAGLRQSRWARLTGSSVNTAGPGQTTTTGSELESTSSATGLLGSGESGAGGAALGMTPFDAYVCLFVRVLWLNQEETFLPYLPDDVRQEYLLEKAPTKTTSTAAGAALIPSLHSPRGGPRARDLVSPLQPTAKQRQCLTAPLNAPEELLTLPPEALRLTYSLDVLSRSPEAGFLTYVYGWTSRGVLSELIFDVLQFDQTVFLALCHEADSQREVIKASLRAEARQRIREARRQARRAQRAAEQAAHKTSESLSPVVPQANDAAKKPKKAKATTTSARGKSKQANATGAKKSKTPGATPQAQTASSPTADPDPNNNKNDGGSVADDAHDGVDDDDDDDGAEPVPQQDQTQPPPCSGCLPLVQIARILATMYPSYSLEKLEQLVVAAAADGTDGADGAAMVYYGVLLPDRLLPGSAGATGRHQVDGGDAQNTARAKGGKPFSAEKATSHSDRARAGSVSRSDAGPGAAELPASPALWRCGRFASLFFSHICDDALEAMGLVEDSLMGMAETLHTSSRQQPVAAAAPPPQSSSSQSLSQSAAHPTQGSDQLSSDERGQSRRSAAVPAASLVGDARAAPVEAVTATEAQLTSLGFTGLPLEQMHAWSAALRSVLHHWPRLRVHVGGGGGGGNNSSHSHAPDDTPNREAAPPPLPPPPPARASSQPTSLRESPYTRSLSSHSHGSSNNNNNTNNASTPAVAAAAGSAPSAVIVPRVSVQEVVAYIRAHVLLRRGPHKLSGAAAAAMNALLPADAVAAVHHDDNQHWSPTHAAYIHVLQSRWNAGHATKSVPAAASAAADAVKGPMAVAESVAAEVGAVDSAAFFAWLRKRDPRREAAWGDDGVASVNPILRPAEDIDDVSDGDGDDSSVSNVGDNGAEDKTSARVPATREAYRRTPTPPPEPRTKNAASSNTGKINNNNVS